MLLLIACSPGAAHQPSTDLSEVLDSIARATLADEPIAGFTVHARRGTTTVFHRAYGLADVGLGVPTTTETRYRLAGPGHTILAVLIMQEVERGTLSLDDDVSEFLPDFPWQGRTVTVRQLLDMSSGLPDYHYLGDPYHSTTPVPKAPDEVTALFAGRPFMHEPGERQQPTISGLHLAGLLLEKVTGERFPTLLDERIVQPLGLQQTSYCVGPEIIPNLATGYLTVGDALVPAMVAEPVNPSTLAFWVPVCSSAGDVAAFYAALTEGRLVSEASLREMLRLTDVAREGLESAPAVWTIAFRVRRRDRPWFASDAQSAGFRTSVDYVPDDSLILVVLENRDGGPSRLRDRLLSALLGLEEPPSRTDSDSAAAPDPIRHLPLTSAERAMYVGRYRWRIDDPPPALSLYERTIRVYDDNGRLMIHVKGLLPQELLNQGEHTFMTAGPVGSAAASEVVFSVENGRATSFRYNGGTGVRVGDGDSRT